MAAKLGALFIAKENDEAKAQVPPSTTHQTKPQMGKRTPAFNKGSGFVFSPVKTGPTSGVPQKAKVVPKKRKVLVLFFPQLRLAQPQGFLKRLK